MKNRFAIAAALLVVFTALSATRLAAQASNPQPGSDEKGWTSYVQFQGSSNSLGQIMLLDASVGYNFSRHWGADVGLPFYFVSNSVNPTTGQTSSSNGIGNAYGDLRLTLKNPLVNYASMLTGYAPTGDSKRGRSTGRATFDWNNRLDRSFAHLTPFVEAGLGNTVPDTMYFTRPFTTLGFVGHFQGGAAYDFLHFFSLGASFYEVMPSGQQKVFSRLVQGQTLKTPKGQVFQTSPEVTGSADLVKDHGYSSWLQVSPSKLLEFQVGYTRSENYSLNTLTFGVGFNLGYLMHSGGHNK